MSNDLIVKSNALVEAGYQLTTNEQRLILCAVACIPKGQPVNPNVGYCVAKGNFVDLGVNPKTANREIREACDRLFNRYVTIKSEQGEFKTRWVQDITKYDQDWALHNRDWFVNVVGEDSYEKDCILASITFSRSVIPFLTELKSNFTKYMLSDISGFGSAYSFRIYEFMMQFQSTGYVKMSIKELRERLDLGDKYPATKDLRVRVIEVATKEINEKSPYFVEYKLIKKGRKFTHLELKFKPKNKEKAPKANPKTPNTLNNFTDLERQTIQERIDEHIKRLEAKGETVGDFHRNNITKKAIDERWGLDVLAEKERKKAEAKAKKEQALAQKKAKAEKERQEKEQAEKSKNTMIAKFESLPHDEQEHVLDQVGEKIGDSAFAGLFKKARKQGTAHKNVMFMHWFFEVLEV